VADDQEQADIASRRRNRLLLVLVLAILALMPSAFDAANSSNDRPAMTQDDAVPEQDPADLP
jgi:hypothetical protein